MRRRERDSESDSESVRVIVRESRVECGGSNCGHTNNERFRGYDTVNVIPVERSSSRVKINQLSAVKVTRITDYR